MPTDPSELIRLLMRKVASLKRLLPSNRWDIRHPLWKPQLNEKGNEQGRSNYSANVALLENSSMHLGFSRPTNPTSAEQRQAVPSSTLGFDMGKTAFNDLESPSTGVVDHSVWPLRLPDGILGASGFSVLPATMQSTPTPANELSSKVPGNTSSPLSFLVDRIQLPSVPGTRGPDKPLTSSGSLSVIEQAQTVPEDEEVQRRDGYIVGEEYSGPGFKPVNEETLEEPPLFAMENISLLPPQARKPINLAVRQFTAQMQRAAVDYCTANNLNCSEQHALETAISVALRTSPTASMFRQISASLSAMEGAITSALRPLGWPADPRTPEAPKPPPKPPVQATQAVQFAFSLVGTAVALLRSFVHITKGPTPLITLDTQLHEHHRNILLALLYDGRDVEGCSMTAPLRYSSNCRSFAIEVPARTDKCSAPASIQGVPSALTVHGFELSCLSSLRCSQHYVAHEPFNFDGRYSLAPTFDSAVSFVKVTPSGLRRQDGSTGILHLYQPEGNKTNSEILKSSVGAVSAVPVRTFHRRHKRKLFEQLNKKCSIQTMWQARSLTCQYCRRDLLLTSKAASPGNVKTCVLSLSLTASYMAHLIGVLLKFVKLPLQTR